jgi:hypothetical protein
MLFTAADTAAGHVLSGLNRHSPDHQRLLAIHSEGVDQCGLRRTRKAGHGGKAAPCRTHLEGPPLTVCASTQTLDCLCQLFCVFGNHQLVTWACYVLLQREEW